MYTTKIYIKVEWRMKHRSAHVPVLSILLHDCGVRLDMLLQATSTQ